MPLTDTRIVTASDGSEPVTLAEAKAHLRIDGVSDDSYIESLITIARAHLEETYGLALIQQTRCLKLDTFPNSHYHDGAKYNPEWPWGYRHFSYSHTQPHGEIIYVPRPPLIAVSEFTYIDGDGNEQPLVEGTDFQVDASSCPGRIAPYYGTSWPSTRSQTFNAVSITYTCGYASAPEPIKRAILLIVGDMYENREETIIAAGSLSKITLDAVVRLMASYQIC